MMGNGKLSPLSRGSTQRIRGIGACVLLGYGLWRLSSFPLFLGGLIQNTLYSEKWRLVKKCERLTESSQFSEILERRGHGE